MLTQERLDKLEAECDKRGHHEWKRRSKNMEMCFNCGKQRIKNSDDTVTIKRFRL